MNRTANTYTTYAHVYMYTYMYARCAISWVKAS